MASSHGLILSMSTCSLDHACAHDSSSFLQTTLSNGAVPRIYLCPLDQCWRFQMPHLAGHPHPGEDCGLEY